LENEEMLERLSVTFHHRNYVLNILGDVPKLFLNDWMDMDSPNRYPSKRDLPICLNSMDNEKIIESVEDKFDLETIIHNKRSVNSIFDNTLWDKAKWRGFGSFFDPNTMTMGIFLAFENEEAGRQIFEDWVKRLGNEDKEEEIALTIIKGVDKNNPHWYKVHIAGNIKPLESGVLLTTVSRFYELEASTSENLDKLIQGFRHLKQYKLCNARVESDGNIKPDFERAILKRNLAIVEAWKITPNDIESLAILKGDCPIIPEGVSNAPVLEVLELRNKGV
jgi:hypothetical protein